MKTKKEIKKKYGKTLVGGTMFTLIAVAFVTGLMINASIFNTVETQPVLKPGWNTVAADGDPGAGASGMLEIFIYPHDADPAVTYASNLSSASAYASRNTWNGTLTGDVPYDTAFDIVIKVRFNTTHAYNSTSSAWEIALVRANITCADLSIGALTAMSKAQITTTATYMWVNFYMNNGGAGYTRTHGVNTNVTSLVIQAYY